MSRKKKPNLQDALNLLQSLPSEISDALTDDSSDHGRSYRRISHINDTDPHSCRSPNMCNYNPTNRAPKSKKGPRRNFDTGPLTASTPVLQMKSQQIICRNFR
ncbi:hypothetical protein TNCV_2155501 [Trichonephila clavipes]|nr:hypothetical protein TNCV_2155501 [Trichonephila clavipes]